LLPPSQAFRIGGFRLAQSTCPAAAVVLTFIFLNLGETGFGGGVAE
jgi:hypothetical protein